MPASCRHVVTLASSRASAGSSSHRRLDRRVDAQQMREVACEVLASSCGRLPNKALQRTGIDKLPAAARLAALTVTPHRAAAERQR